MCKFKVGMKVYTMCKLDPKRIGIVQSITPTGRINVAFSNGHGSTYTMQFSKNGTNGKGYFQTTLGIPTPEIEEEIRRQDVILNARTSLIIQSPRVTSWLAIRHLAGEMMC